MFLASTAVLGEEVEQVCARLDPALRRVNLEILGNTDPFLRAHVWPRYEWEPTQVRGRPVWLYPQAWWSDPATALGAQHDALRAAILERLVALSGAEVDPA